jgi:acetylornithine/N-succinyldiaminopimelate aminotransferase
MSAIHWTNASGGLFHSYRSKGKSMTHILECYEIVKTDFVRGENASLYDARGKRYVDLESGCWAAVIGHNHPRIQRAMRRQIGKIMHIGKRYPNQPVETAAAGVLEITGLEGGKCVFLSSGSEAVELGVRAARRAAGKPLCLTFTNSYLAAYGSAGGKSGEDWLLLDWSQAAAMDPGKFLAGIPFERIGAFVFEPGGSGIGFVRFPPEALVREIARRIHQAGGWIVANEITTGMGRTGKWFGFQHYGVQPDVVALGKGLGNGYPVSAVAFSGEMARKLESGEFHYIQSHQNDPLGCAVASEVIAVLREGNWIEKGNALGGYFLEGLGRVQEKHALLKEARGRGLLLGLEFQTPGKLSVAQAQRALLGKGFLVGYYSAGNVLRFDPSLTIEKKEITRFLKCLDAVLTAAG